MANEKAITKAPEAELNMSERFMQKVMAEFGGKATGELRINDYQRTLIQGYFIAIDRALKTAEEERVRRNENNRDHKYDNTLPITWANVNLPELALDVVHYARLGLDMMQPATLYPIPYKNKKANRYDITLMEGYNGIRYIAENYALIRPKSVTVEVVYSKDAFHPLKKSRSNPIESYEFEVTSPFDRGEIVGGFGYIEYEDASRNELIIMTMKDIQKRKPAYASANFWGGQTKEWKNGKQEEVEKEGWLDEMVRKTIIREVYGGKHIPRDPRRIDESYQQMKQQEARLRAAAEDVRQEINVTANTVPLEETEAIAEPKVRVERLDPTANPKPEIALYSEKQESPFAGDLAEQAAPQEEAEDHLAGANF